MTTYYGTPSNYAPRQVAYEPLSTPEQLAGRLQSWDAQASSAAARWCADPFGLGCMSLAAAANIYSRADVWTTYFCPTCIEGAA